MASGTPVAAGKNALNNTLSDIRWYAEEWGLDSAQVREAFESGIVAMVTGGKLNLPNFILDTTIAPSIELEHEKGT
jgi:hypothetical protein